MMVPFTTTLLYFIQLIFLLVGLQVVILLIGLLLYLGPMEKGIKYTFKIFNGTSVVYNVTGISSDYSVFTSGYFSNIDFQNPLTFTHVH